MQEITLQELLEAGCHFGHKADRWHPKANAFIYQERDGIHVIDLAKTKIGLEKAREIVRQMAMQGKTILFFGTKRQASSIIREEATRAGAPFITQRWIGGFLTNWTEVHKNIQKIRKLTEEQANNAWKKYPKHERVKLSRYLTKLNYLYSGVVQLDNPPDAVFVVDIKKEKVGVFEARKRNIPVIGVVDTNSDPGWVTHAIPSNDDAVGAISCIVKHIADAYLEGRESFAKEQEKAAVKKAAADKKVAEDILKAQATKVEAKPEVATEQVKAETKPADEQPKKKVGKKKAEEAKKAA